MLARTVLSILLVLVPATSFADSAGSADEELTVSYRDQTLVADGIGLALLVAGGLAEGDNGEDSDASNSLFAIGGLTMMLGAPFVHGARGHSGRAMGSFFMRGALASAGMVVAIAANSGCDDNKNEEGAFLDPDFLCELDYVGYGLIGGLVVASVVDAALMTDETVETTRSWTPQVSATRDGGMRVGAAFAW